MSFLHEECSACHLPKRGDPRRGCKNWAVVWHWFDVVRRGCSQSGRLRGASVSWSAARESRVKLESLCVVRHCQQVHRAAGARRASPRGPSVARPPQRLAVCGCESREESLAWLAWHVALIARGLHVTPCTTQLESQGAARSQPLRRSSGERLRRRRRHQIGLSWHALLLPRATPTSSLQ